MAESRYLFDQLAVLSPIFLALTAASPIFKGRLADVDVRWSTISAAVDDRTPAERGVVAGGGDGDGDGGGGEAAGAGAGARAGEAAGPAAAAGMEGDPRMAGGGTHRLKKSRYDSISGFIYQARAQTNPNMTCCCCLSDS